MIFRPRRCSVPALGRRARNLRLQGPSGDHDGYKDLSETTTATRTFQRPRRLQGPSGDHDGFRRPRRLQGPSGDHDGYIKYLQRREVPFRPSGVLQTTFDHNGRRFCCTLEQSRADLHLMSTTQICTLATPYSNRAKPHLIPTAQSHTLFQPRKATPYVNLAEPHLVSTAQSRLDQIDRVQ
jgi:hypothetical protein